MPDRPQRISVIVCAYSFDRWDALRAAIDSLHAQTRPPDEVILVIDHNPDLLARAAAEIQGVAVVANGQARGLSGARNTGVAQAKGDLIGFLDDDAVAAPIWLEKLEACFRDPDVLGATGPVEPIWLGRKPGWFPDEFLWTVGCSFPGAEALAGGEVRNLMGCSMLFRRTVFEAIGGFSHRLGRTESGASLLSCEETEFCIRARAAFPAGKFVAATAARIGHKVGASRLTLRYFCRRTFAEGISKALVAALALQAGVLETETTYVLEVLGQAVLRNLRAGLLRLDPDALAQAGSILLGLGCAGLGYIRGRGMAWRLPGGGGRPAMAPDATQS